MDHRSLPGRDTPDLDLIAAAREVDDAAVEELYRRHRKQAMRLARRLTDPVTAEDVVADAFLRVFRAIREDRGPATAFRPYLLSVVRNVYVDHVRHDRPLVWTGDREYVAELVGAVEETDRSQESRLIAEAFRTLPERWQAVLWHTAVEGHAQESVGRLLGIKANAVAALSFRAREGLRRAYLAAHLGAAAAEDCRPVHDRLPAYVRGGLGSRHRALVEEHLRACRACTEAVAETERVNAGLGAVLGLLA